MSTKTKSALPLPLANPYVAVQQIGTVLMAAAITLGMLEMPDHGNSKIVIPSQPVLVFAGENEETNNPVRREREDVEPHFVSYSEVQRTPSRSGHI